MHFLLRHLSMLGMLQGTAEYAHKVNPPEEHMITNITLVLLLLRMMSKKSRRARALTRINNIQRNIKSAYCTNWLWQMIKSSKSTYNKICRIQGNICGQGMLSRTFAQSAYPNLCNIPIPRAPNAAGTKSTPVIYSPTQDNKKSIRWRYYLKFTNYSASYSYSSLGNGLEVLAT